MITKDTFITFLKENKAYTAYCRNFKLYHHLYMFNPEESLDNFLNRTHCYWWIGEAFGFWRTVEGNAYWLSLSMKWRSYESKR